MTSVVQPDLIPQPWSQNGSHTTIPDTTSEFGRASWALGFPPETALPLNAGGIPPNWLDFQGVLHALSQHTIFEQAGGRYAWDSGINYPQGACIIGSNGVVYQALQESGPGTSAGAKNPTSSGNSAYWAQMAFPDGRTIRIVNGKLTVHTATMASELADGETIIAVNGKLSAVGGSGGGGDAADLVDNITTVASGGKIKVDLSSATATALNGIAPYLAQPNGGLLIDQSTGKLLVDYSKISGLIWLTSQDKDFYVDGSTGIDTFDGVQGKSAARPWKTISFATQMITRYYNINEQAVNIYIAGGTYNELVPLPAPYGTTGVITLRPVASEDIVTIVGTATENGHRCFTHYGGYWELLNLDIKLVVSPSSATTMWASLGYSVSKNGSLWIHGCNLSFEDNSTSGQNAIIRLINAAGGYIFLSNPSGTGTVTWQGTKQHANEVSWLHGEDMGLITVSKGAAQKYRISGSYTIFCHLTQGSMYNTGGSGNPAEFIDTDNPTGKRYQITGSSHAMIGGGSTSTYFPGTSSGTIETSTYCSIST